MSKQTKSRDKRKCEKYQNNPRKAKDQRIRSNKKEVGEYSKQFSTNDVPNPRKDVSEGRNDVSWYARNSVTLNNAATLPFSAALGLPLTDFYSGWQKPGTNNNCNVVPGIMSLGLDFIPGLSNGASSPLNVASQSIYSYVRSKNSKTLGYDRNDLIITIMAIDSFFTMWNWAKRAYTTLKYVDVYNRYTPMHLVEAMNIDYNDLSAKASDFRFKLNMLAARAESMAIPGNIPIFARHSWCVSNIFKDASSSKAQMYIMNPYSYYVYDELSTPNHGSYLQYNVIKPNSSSSLLKADDIINILETQLDAILNSEDIALISGDISAAYGGTLAVLSDILEDELIVPAYNEAVLSQIHNATILPSGLVSRQSAEISTWNITQNPATGEVLFNPSLFNDIASSAIANNLAEGAAHVGDWIINSRFDSPTPSDNMISTRLINRLKIDVTSGSDEGSYNWNVSIATCGTEIVHEAYIYSLVYNNGTPSLTRMSLDTTVGANTPTDTTFLDFLQSITQKSTFDWSPNYIFYTVPTITDFSSVASVTANCKIIGMQCDQNNYLIINTNTLQNMNQLAILNEFGIDA